MKTILSLTLFLLLNHTHLQAQQFIKEGAIEYEVRTNIQKTMGSSVWDNLIKENLPTFKTGYYTLTFTGNKSIYKFDHWVPGMKLPDYLKRVDEEQAWYNNYDTHTMSMAKQFAGTKFVISDTIRNLEWRLINEYRLIAGFNCKKAVAIVFDSVYVFAFYTEEILLPGGPFSINGLPGTVLGVTIPRLYTSWIATKVMVKDVDTGIIKPIESKKTYTYHSLSALLHERLKDWYSDDDPESAKARDRMHWGLFL